jgi:DNA-binding NarL/FixJ family response regulator
MSEKRPTVLLADDHPMMLEGLRKLLVPDFEVVGTVTDGRALLAAARIWRPALVLTDISMPGMDGLEATRRLRAIVPEARVLILSIHTEPSWMRAAVEAGAWGYLPKTSAPEEIETAVREVLEGRSYFSPAVTRAVFASPRERSVAGGASSREASGEALTPRELDIVRLVGKGLCNKEIAHALGVSVTTIRTHLNKVYDKLEPESRVELALYAANAGETVM